MRNPYEDELPLESINLSRKFAIAYSLLFLACITLPALLHELQQRAKPQAAKFHVVSEFYDSVIASNDSATAAQRLKRFESSLEQNLFFGRGLRQAAQKPLLSVYGQGNDRTLLGGDGWLFYRPEIVALTGAGPVKPQPPTINMAPEAAKWQPPIPVILEFAAELKLRGIELWLVPIPMKQSIYPEMLSKSVFREPVLHPDEAAFAARMHEGGVRYVSLAPTLWEAKKHDKLANHVYLKQDTHWSPRGMEAAATHLTQLLAAHYQISRPAPPAALPLAGVGRGDLVEKLDLAPPFAFEEEAVTLSPQPLWTSDPEAEIVLLGDSFVNIFHDPSLGYGPAGGPAAEGLHAGLAQTMMAMLGQRMDVLAMNGGGASTVRQQFAKRPAAALKKKKAVVWVLAARDLFLSRAAAMKNDVHWRTTTFAKDAAEVPPVEAKEPGRRAVIAKVDAISNHPANPKTAPYADAVVSVRYRLESTLEGEPPAESELVVMHWLFRQREPLPAAKLKPGERVKLILQPWETASEAQSKTLLDDFAVIDCYWSQDFERLP
jgi:hypothetical protein